jgi:hypothetical protein
MSVPVIRRFLLASCIGAALLCPTSGFAQGSRAKGAMVQCVSRVLSRAARSNTPSDQVGQVVVSECDRQLQNTLAEAIANGEAAFCSIESCIDIARQRAAEEARTYYQARFGR